MSTFACYDNFAIYEKNSLFPEEILAHIKSRGGNTFFIVGARSDTFLHQ